MRSQRVIDIPFEGNKYFGAILPVDQLNKPVLKSLLGLYLSMI